MGFGASVSARTLRRQEQHEANAVAQLCAAASIQRRNVGGDGYTSPAGALRDVVTARGSAHLLVSGAAPFRTAAARKHGQAPGRGCSPPNPHGSLTAAAFGRHSPSSLSPAVLRSIPWPTAYCSAGGIPGSAAPARSPLAANMLTQLPALSLGFSC